MGQNWEPSVDMVVNCATAEVMAENGCYLTQSQLGGEDDGAPIADHLGSHVSALLGSRIQAGCGPEDK